MGIKKLRLICLLIVLFISILIAYSAYTIWSFSQEDQLVHSDSAIVLGAAVWGDQPSPVFRERINHSISLYKNGYVKKLYLLVVKEVKMIILKQKLLKIMQLKMV